MYCEKQYHAWGRTNVANENRLIREGFYEMELLVQTRSRKSESGRKHSSVKALGQECACSQLSDREPRKS